MDSMIQLPLSAINEFLYCERSAGLKFVELIVASNHHTIKGKQLHKRVDLPGYHHLRATKVIRGFSVWSKQLGIYGRCDVVEISSNNVLMPVEYKKGVLKSYKNSNAQVCAQALCLEEMFNTKITHGAIFHAASKRRRKVHFTEELRDTTKKTIESIRTLIASQNVPKGQYNSKCHGCSMKQHCLPEITGISKWSYQKSKIFTPREIKQSS